MKKKLDLQTWPRREHFEFFSKFEEPFFGATVSVDCTLAYENAKSIDVSFFIYYLHKTLMAVNQVEPFGYRIEDGDIYVYDRVDVSPTIGRNDGSFGFAFVEFSKDFDLFKNRAVAEIGRIERTSGLFTREFENNLIHFSALPWIDFTSLSHARSYSISDSCPKISFGKMSVDANGKRTMPMSVHVHHALMDGLHVGRFIALLQEEMNRK